MKKFEPHYRLVRYGMATKIEKASRQQRTFYPFYDIGHGVAILRMNFELVTLTDFPTGKQRKNRSKEFRGTAKTKGAKKDKK
jgi:small subunit ribosomal protein S24e